MHIWLRPEGVNRDRAVEGGEWFEALKGICVEAALKEGAIRKGLLINLYKDKGIGLFWSFQETSI